MINMESSFCLWFWHHICFFLFVYICGRKWLSDSASKKTTGKISKIPGLIRVEKQLLIFFDKMKKTYFMVLALASMLCLGFNSCGDDDDDDSSSTSAVDSTMLKSIEGTYSANYVFYMVTANGTMVKDTTGSTEGESFSTVKVSLHGSTGLLIKDISGDNDSGTPDSTICTGLTAISKGLSFNVSTTKQDGAMLKGYSKPGTDYNGSFNSSAKTIVYYQQMSTSEFLSLVGVEKAERDVVANLYPTIVIESTLSKH